MNETNSVYRKQVAINLLTQKVEWEICIVGAQVKFLHTIKKGFEKTFKIWPLPLVKE